MLFGPGLQPGCRIAWEQVRSHVLCVPCHRYTTFEQRHLRKLFSTLIYRWIHLGEIGKQRSCHLIVKQLSSRSAENPAPATLTRRENPLGQLNQMGTGMRRTNLTCPFQFRFVETRIRPRVYRGDAPCRQFVYRFGSPVFGSRNRRSWPLFPWKSNSWLIEFAIPSKDP